MIDLDSEVGISAIKIIHWNTKVGMFAVKTITGLVFEINNNNMHIKITLIE